MQLPRISIITPSFNQGKYLEECICSVLDQNYPNLEFIIIDGGSTDNSVEIIKKYADKLSYWVSEKDRGQSHAINKGIEHSTGEIISWLCSDDLYLPDALQQVADEFSKHPEVGLIHGKTILFGENRKDLVKGADKRDLQLKYFSIIPYPQPSSFFRRKIITEQGPLDELFHFGMDYDLLIRIALHYPIQPVDFILSKYRFHSESKTVKILPAFAQDWSKVFLKFLRSVSGGSKYIDILSAIKVSDENTSTYTHTRKFDNKELQTIFCHFLLNQLIIYYEVLNKKECLKFLKLLYTIDIDFYNYFELNKINFRIRYIPKTLLSRIRDLKRS